MTGSVSKNAMLSRSATHQRLGGAEVDRLGDGGAGHDDRAGLDAQPAAGAVLDVDLQRVPGVRQPDGVQRRRVELVRRALQVGLVVVLGADHAVRADEAAVAALDAAVGIPHRDQLGDVALLVGRRAARVGAVHRQCADRQRVAASGHHLRGDGADELRRVVGHRAAPVRASEVDRGRAPRPGAARPPRRRPRPVPWPAPRRRGCRRSWRPTP